jgi:hypothetical protein
MIHRDGPEFTRHPVLATAAPRAARAVGSVGRRDGAVARDRRSLAVAAVDMQRGSR